MGFTKSFKLPRKLFLVSVKEVIRKTEAHFEVDHLRPLQLAQ